ncbi:integrase, partial [Chloroflexota bacterium]
IMNDRQLTRIVKEYTTYYNECRPHQGIGQQIPSSPDQPETGDVDGKIISLPVLGGLHHDYRRRAA